MLNRQNVYEYNFALPYNNEICVDRHKKVITKNKYN